MAKVTVSGNYYILELSFWEKIGAFHASPKARISSLVSITEFKDPWRREVLKGWRAPGTGIPFIILLGTMRYRGGKDFLAICGRKPVKKYHFRNEDFVSWIVTS